MTSYLLVFVLMAVLQTTFGHGRFRGLIPNGWNVPHPCGRGQWEAVGHMGPDYTPDKNVFGRGFLSGGRVWNRRICQQDSDGDGMTNGEELGDPNCRWSPGQTPEGPALGHPGMCEPNRRSCTSGSSYRECPHAGGGGGGGGGVSGGSTGRLPVGANDHPQSFLSKQMAGLVPSQTASRGMGSGTQMRGQGQGFSQGFGQQTTQFPGSGGMGGGFQQQEMPSFGVFQQNLDQRNIMGGGTNRGFGGQMAPGSFGMSGGSPNFQSQVQMRLQQERMRGPSNVDMWSFNGGRGGAGGATFGSGGATFGSGGSFPPMSPMGSFMNGGQGGMSMSGMGQGMSMGAMRFPQF